MQEHFQTISEFIRRTDALSDRSGLNLSEIHGILGVSKAMVFAYRSGKNPISAKVWRKLEAAELAAGLSPPGSGNAQNSVKAKDLPPPEERNYSSILREESPLERIRQMQKQIQEPPAGAKLDGFLERIAIALERLVEIEEERNRKS